MSQIDWKRNDGNYYYDVAIDHTYIQLQFNNIKKNIWLYVVYFEEDEDINSLKDSVYNDIIDFIDLNDAPEKFEKILFTSNSQKMIEAFYRYIEQTRKYTKQTSYINGKPFPSLVNNEFNNLLENIKQKITNIFEMRKIKDDYINIIYSCKNGNVKFTNYTYDYSIQKYKVKIDDNLNSEEIISVLKDFIKEKDPDILNFNKMDKKISSFLEKTFRKEDNHIFIKK